MLWQLPWKVMRGNSGFLPHLVLAALFLPAMNFGLHNYKSWLHLVCAGPDHPAHDYYLCAHRWRAKERWHRVALPSGGLATAGFGVRVVRHDWLARSAHLIPSVWLIAALTFAVAVFYGAFVFARFWRC